ncbi:hypothetical protein Lsan_1797 [Legionella santicrucis]|uniref:Uncharacterized protein n=1 Tax=Legionella santicrucis TaxID=45074 RepID=A0A0W0Z0J5_9GAMM|nr:hypothetical protein [Legionella santicrucis]KTD62660.1 hypothetical protein Lsan_1797 [Legionella santicrucis]
MSRFAGGKGTRHFNKKGNIMTPLNWLAAIVTSSLFAIPKINSIVIISLIVALVFLVVFFYAGMYVYWSITDPNRLQSEQYNIETKEMALRIEPSDIIEAIENKAEIITMNKTD